VGFVLRRLAYKLILGRIGNNCLIGKNVRFSVPKNIFLGNGVKIGEGCIIEARSFGSKIRIGDNVQISRYTTVKSAEGDVDIGENVVIGPFSILEGWGGLEIGKNAIISFHVVIMSIMYEFEDCSYPINQHPARIGKVIISEDSWLGTHVVVLPGIKIGKGAIVGAGGVVTKDIPEYYVAAGVPAKVIRKRGEKNEV
jgi:acetyltransferase-like isoleucine patch superfamily enzyme